MSASVPGLFAKFVCIISRTTSSHQALSRVMPGATQSIDMMAEHPHTVATIEWASVALLAEALRAPGYAHREHAEPVAICEKKQHTTNRPLASQIAITNRLNVKKGRKQAKKAHKTKSNCTRRRTTAIRSKLTAKSSQKKRAPKRRHVWLSTQKRVIRPTTSNIMTFQNTGCSVGRCTTSKQNLRAIRLAA
jgi:hypothetical protein